MSDLPNKQSAINNSLIHEHEIGVDSDIKPKNGLRKRTHSKEDDDGDGGEYQISPKNYPNEGQALLGKKEQPVEREPRCYALRRWFSCIVSREKRTLNMNG